MSSQSDRLIRSEADCLWINVSDADAIHAELLAAHGGLSGVRDRSALESALMRPRQKLSHVSKPLPLSALAAAYSFGITRDHPYNDGNKRTAFTVANVFLLINGARIRAEQSDVVRTMILLAAGEFSEEDFARWVKNHLAPR